MTLPSPDIVDQRTKSLKELSLVRNIHNLNPNLNDNNQQDGVAIVNAIKSSPIIQEAAMELEGYYYDPITRKVIKTRDAVMNKQGIANFITTISNISKNFEFSSLKEKEIPKLVKHLFRLNYPYYTIYHQDYKLDRKDFNLIANLLVSFILASTKKAQGSGHRNVIRGTYSEDLLGKYVGGGMGNLSEDKNKFNLKYLNPFKKSSGNA